MSQVDQLIVAYLESFDRSLLYVLADALEEEGNEVSQLVRIAFQHDGKKPPRKDLITFNSVFRRVAPEVKKACKGINWRIDGADLSHISMILSVSEGGTTETLSGSIPWEYHIRSYSIHEPEGTSGVMKSQVSFDRRGSCRIAPSPYHHAPTEYTFPPDVRQTLEAMIEAGIVVHPIQGHNVPNKPESVWVSYSFGSVRGLYYSRPLKMAEIDSPILRLILLVMLAPVGSTGLAKSLMTQGHFIS